MTSEPAEQRRRFPRVNVQLSARYRPLTAGKGAKFRQDPLITIAEGGCFIQAKLTYPKGTKLEILFTVEGVEISAKASVRYAVPFSPGAQSAQFPGMGLEFEALDPDHANAIRQFVVEERTRMGLGMSG